MPTRILIIDDSAMMRGLLTQIFAADSELQVVGAASDPVAAWQKIQQLRPDVITLDVEMPRMDGLTFLARLMRADPRPVLMVSSLTERGCATTLRALELGAVDFVQKPKLDIAAGTVQLADELRAKVKLAARAKPRPCTQPSQEPQAQASAQPLHRPRQSVAPAGALLRSTEGIVAIGASTGGTEALREVLTALPADAPAIVVVQHMPEKFTKAFAARLDSLCRVRVSEAKDGDRVLPGHVLIAPGSFHMRLLRSGASYSVQVATGPAVNHHRPSVDVLFESCARCVGGNALGALLTGMGDDGARGLLEMRKAGARTIAQDEASCVVFGMPGAAVAIGAAEVIAPLGKVAGNILAWAGLRA